MNVINRLLARPLGVAMLGLGLLAGLSGCASASRVGVSTDFDHAVNFRSYKTWSWYPDQTTDAEGGPAKGYHSFFDKRMRAAVERELAEKGLTRNDEDPDLYVAYSARVEDKQQQSNNAYYGPYGFPYWYGYGAGRPLVVNYRAGNVIIDLVDAQRKELVWRGYGQAEVNQLNISEAEVYRIVDEVLGAYLLAHARPAANFSDKPR